MDAIDKWDGSKWNGFKYHSNDRNQGVLSGRLYTLMDARELQKLFHELLDKNPNFEQFVRNVSLIVSYLISEQDKRRELGKQIEEHTKAMNEERELRIKMSIGLEQIRDRGEKNTKLLRMIFGTVVSGIILYLLQIAFIHKP